MSDFELEAWEVPPGIEQGGSEPYAPIGPLSWKGRQMMFSFRLVNWDDIRNVAFFRAQNGGINHVILDGAGFCIPWLFPSDLTQDKVADILRDSLNGKQFHYGRLFQVEDGLCIVEGKRIGWLNLRADLTILLVPFNPMVGQSERVFEWLQGQLNKPNSEVRFSYDWSCMGEEQIYQFYCECIPRWREIHEVMTWVAQLEGLPDGHPWWPNRIRLPEAPEIEKRLAMWGKALYFLFQPDGRRLFWELRFPKNSPKCLLKHFHGASSNIHIYGASASAHQRLEARLQLREWLEANAPDQIEKLLSS